MCKITTFPTLLGISDRLCSVKELESIRPDSISGLLLTSLSNLPTATVEVEFDEESCLWYNHPMTTGAEVHVFNSFLRSLELGESFDLYIEFKTFQQYSKLLKNATERLTIKHLLKEMNSAADIEDVISVLLDDFDTFGFNALVEGAGTDALEEYVQTAVKYLDRKAKRAAKAVKRNA